LHTKKHLRLSLVLTKALKCAFMVTMNG